MVLHSASETGSPAAKLGYRPALDGIRALAIALVVGFHTLGFPAGGFLGVDLFFVLSGFLITTLLLEEHREHGRISLRGFYRRRALRLLPALFVLLGVFLALAVLEALVRGGSVDKAVFGVVAGVGYFSNFVMTLEPDTMAMPNELRHLWSLAIEEQFYVVWPLVLVVLLRARVRLALAVLAGGLVLTAAQQVRLYVDGANWERIGFGTDTRTMSVLVGCLLAVLLATGARPRVEAIVRRIGPLALAGFVALVLVDPERKLFLGPLLLFGISSALLIVCALDGRSLVARALSLRPFVFLGRISYALYLWHIPIYITLRLGQYAEWMDALGLALALLCATASYYLVELPFLRRKHRRRPAETRAPVPETVPALGSA
jgi:peptidoglycan/LPS O-acetylase OafA/YrhL